ncbi:hypothetical protein RJT34_02176 [Clitoria ternatea]|uniref:Uncharacterized protein n=1 Tax=Clitoria ternatea TaxID=43366 RepID=A0AAN9PYV7_CLITE
MLFMHNLLVREKKGEDEREKEMREEGKRIEGTTQKVNGGGPKKAQNWQSQAEILSNKEKEKQGVAIVVTGAHRRSSFPKPAPLPISPCTSTPITSDPTSPAQVSTPDDRRRVLLREPDRSSPCNRPTTDQSSSSPPSSCEHLRLDPAPHRGSLFSDRVLRGSVGPPPFLALTADHLLPPPIVFPLSVSSLSSDSFL